MHFFTVQGTTTALASAYPGMSWLLFPYMCTFSRAM